MLVWMLCVCGSDGGVVARMRAWARHHHQESPGHHQVGLEGGRHEGQMNPKGKTPIHFMESEEQEQVVFVLMEGKARGM